MSTLAGLLLLKFLTEKVLASSKMTGVEIAFMQELLESLDWCRPAQSQMNESDFAPRELQAPSASAM